MTPVLEVQDLTQDFGGLRALNEVSLTVEEREIVALIGPNGAGKTTFFNCVTGIYTPTEGKVHLYDAQGQQHLLNGVKPHKITMMGMARTFQNIRLFGEMTVLENVMIGRHCRTSTGVWGALVRDSRSRREEQASIDRAMPCSNWYNWKNSGTKPPTTCPTAHNAAWKSPALWPRNPHALADEPAAGMNPQETNELKDLVLSIRDAKKSPFCSLSTI